MNKITFSVQGSELYPYTVTFTKEGNNLNAFCDCKAGINGMYCKHRFNILNGETEGIVSKNLGDVKTIVTWLSGSDIELAIKKVKLLEVEMEQKKQELTKAKKELAHSMRH